MGTLRRAVVAPLVMFGLVLGTAHLAHADAKGDIAGKSKEAMENYDMMDYGAAKKLLNQALAQAKKAKLDKDPLTAKIYLRLGIAAFADSDPDSALIAFQSAVEIDPKIQIDAAYKSPELQKLLDQAKADAGGGNGGGGGDAGADCTGVKGLQHTLIDTATGGKAAPIELLLGSDVASTTIILAYRPEGATDFVEVKMAKSGGCKYTGTIPGKALHGTILQYYVAAMGANGKPIASKGSSGSPNLIDIEGGGAAGSGGGDDEDPIGEPGGTTTVKPEPKGGEISGGLVQGGQPPKVYVNLAVGSGIGYVQGRTESTGQMVQTCCIGASLVVITPEFGFYASPTTSIGLAARLGLPLGANADGHSTLAPAGLLRIRHAFRARGDGLRVMAQLGVGILRNTIKVESIGGDKSQDMDIVAQGPLLVGGGVGYMKKLSTKVAFIFDVSILAGVAVTDKLGTATLNSGVSGDASIGLAFGL